MIEFQRLPQIDGSCPAIPSKVLKKTPEISISSEKPTLKLAKIIIVSQLTSMSYAFPSNTAPHLVIGPTSIIMPSIHHTDSSCLRMRKDAKDIEYSESDCTIYSKELSLAHATESL